MVRGRPQDYRITSLGHKGVGKTALWIQFAETHFVEAYDPTGEEVRRKQFVVDGEDCMVYLQELEWDDAQYPAITDQIIRDGEAIHLVYSVASRASFDYVRTLYERVRTIKGEALPRTPIVLLGNGSDRPPEDRQVSTEEGEALAEEIDAAYFFETSAKDSKNVEKTFHETVRVLRRIQQPDDPQHHEPGLHHGTEGEEASDRGFRHRLSRFVAKLKP